MNVTKISAEEIAAMAQGVKGIHVALIEAGFSSTESLTLIGTVLGQGLGAALAAAAMEASS